MTSGYLTLQRQPSGKLVHIHAGFVGIINETKGGTMWVLLDGNQVYTGISMTDAIQMHAKALRELPIAPAADKVFEAGREKSARRQEKELRPPTDSQAESPTDFADDDEIPF